MLIYLKIKNFRSIKDERVFSMEASSIKELRSSVYNVRDHKLLPVAVFYGANSSGKTNILLALQKMRRLVLRSVKLNPGDKLDYEPFELNNHTLSEPTMFEVQFISDTTIYRYGFEYDKDIIYKEWLFEKQEKQKEYNLFARVESNFDISKTRFPEGLGKEESTETNRLFISLVAQLKGAKAKLILDWFKNSNVITGLDTEGYEGITIEMLKNNKEGSKQALDFFHHLQLGFNNIVFIERKFSEVAELLSHTDTELLEKYKDETVIETLTTHNVYNDDKVVVSQRNFSKDKKESEGTKKIIEISGPLFDTLINGKVLFVDELDAKLHPLLTISIVKLFMNKNTNPKGAQLVFATHDTHLLNLSILRRDMIWFAEKDCDESTDIYSLIEFKDENGLKVRNDRSIEKDYFNGRYGAIPFMQ
ncbi:MAG: ATP-binding protein [Bacteroidales bacterium]|nr:ATP-binding protein [Bacteroidales bacterium]